MTPGIILGILCIGLMLTITALMWVLSRIEQERKKREAAKRIKKNDSQCERWYELWAEEEIGKC